VDVAAPVLVVQHEDQAPLAWLGEWLTEAGVHLDVRRPYAGDELPATLTGYAGLVVLGGEMGAYDDGAHPWLAQTKRLLAEAMRADIATLGVCLGHQLASVARGGAVAKHPSGRQIGIFPLAWTAAAADDALFADLPGARGMYWNDDVVVDVPADAVVLAGTSQGGPQVLRLAPRAWSVQFHPEVGYDVVCTWTGSEGQAGSSRDPQVEAMLAELRDAEAELRRTWQPVAQRFAHQIVDG
jgi:GMP synthase (glutamine-hydrolysing)